ncbi:aminoglycoside phosphotransferase family protein [Couchioplanes caeruleus]|uniref:phosphotransferase n=1 Tax=Couchioplanes caeruleus TaxID=56438 RepID=UPI0020BF389A|nr:phosphotransferase [Couchioplanes caeruleus]UQU67244.1 aminoglycoside phosphotransferase family protein [Couchioplanes caeruleus]
MLTPPADLPEGLLREAFALAELEYAPVGWGSHHWTATGVDGTRWFLTVDELDAGRPGASFERLRRAFDAASALRLPFVVAPVRPVQRVGEKYAGALYPYIWGESFSWGDWPAESHRAAVLDMLVAVHTAPSAAGRAAAADDFTIPHRDGLEATLTGGNVAGTGPFAAPAARLIGAHAARIRAELDRYDELAASADRSRSVLTHGEPHPGNTMRAADGWKLIDWETALLAPPERDLWLLGGDLTGYTAATGVRAEPGMLELYRRRWLINDLCVDLHRFRRPHSGNPEDEECWQLLRANVERGLT